MAKKNVASTKKMTAPTLDLHGYKLSDVPDAVDRFLVKHSNAPRLRIMTGKGTGQVLKEVQKYLKLGGYPHSFETLENGSKNTGVLVIFND